MELMTRQGVVCNVMARRACRGRSDEGGGVGDASRGDEMDMAGPGLGIEVSLCRA